MRSATLNRPCLFGFTVTATVTSSNRLAARPMMSRCPLVTGSKEPGQTTLRTIPPGRSWRTTLSPGWRSHREARRRDRTKASPRRSGGPCPARIRPASSVATRSGPGSRVRRRPRHQEPASDLPRQRNQHVHHRSALQRVRRVQERDVERVGGGAAGDEALDGRDHQLQPREAEGRDVRPDRGRGLPVRLDQQRALGPPRDTASSPTAPEPAYRSSTRTPASEPRRLSSAENNASRARSAVGRVARPGGVTERSPAGAAPAMTRVTTCPGSPALAGSTYEARAARSAGCRCELRVVSDDRAPPLRGRAPTTSPSSEHAEQPQRGARAGLRRPEHVALPAGPRGRAATARSRRRSPPRPRAARGGGERRQRR